MVIYFFKVGPDNPPCLTGNVLQQWYCLNLIGNKNQLFEYYQ